MGNQNCCFKLPSVPSISNNGLLDKADPSSLRSTSSDVSSVAAWKKAIGGLRRREPLFVEEATPKPDSAVDRRESPRSVVALFPSTLSTTSEDNANILLKAIPRVVLRKDKSVVPVPSWRDLPADQREEVWTDVEERYQNEDRARWESQWEQHGNAAPEEDEMVLWEGEYIHPATWYVMVQEEEEARQKQQQEEEARQKELHKHEPTQKKKKRTIKRRDTGGQALKKKLSSRGRQSTSSHNNKTASLSPQRRSPQRVSRRQRSTASVSPQRQRSSGALTRFADT